MYLCKHKCYTKIYNNLLNAFVNQGIAQHDYKGGFNEAILILTF